MDDVYSELLARKRIAFEPKGFAPCAMPAAMRPHQADATRFAVEVGCAALFLDTGLGKTLCALEWAKQVQKHTGRPVLMFAPLAVGEQHVREADRFGYDARQVRDQSQADENGVVCTYITNYERLDKFDLGQFGGVVLDESSVLKSFTGKTTRALMAACSVVPYRLACTATPAPNDHTELGTHAEFLSVMRREEMLARWFVHDSANVQDWRLKRHAVADFWDWVASWARCISRPSDIGHDDTGYMLPPLNLHRHEVDVDLSDGATDMLFRIPEVSATSMHREKRRTSEARAQVIAECVEQDPLEPWIVWCDTDDEADRLLAAIPHANEVRGSMPAALKAEKLVAFSQRETRVLITKPSIAGFGLNWQHCARVAFVGLSFSYESFYQAVRRCWRFGQERPVEVHVAMSPTERAIYDTISRKRGDHETMKREMANAMRRAAKVARVDDYGPTRIVPLPQHLENVYAESA